jgi:ABC-type oligopeptide transport system substrate-binding subunit
VQPVLARAVGLLVVVCAVASSPTARAADAPAPKTFSFATPLSVEMQTRGVDPACIEGPDDERVVLACFDGLTAFDASTGKIVPAAAASWTTSKDGRTWTFTLRDATWMRRAGKTVEEAGRVKASDFVYAWKRLFEPENASPSLHILDGLVGVVGLSTDKRRYLALDQIAEALQEATGGKGQKKTITADDLQTLLTSETLNMRGWLGSIDAPEIRELLAWPVDRPYQGLKVWGVDKKRGVLEILKAETDRSVKVSSEADEHVGVDRGFYAKDEKTLVVETIDPAPWLPSLLARGALVAVDERSVDSNRDQAFNKRQNQVCNGAFVSYTDFAPKAFDGSGEPLTFNLELHKNPKHWSAASVPSDRMIGFVNNTSDELLRLYCLGQCHWIQMQALAPPVAERIRAAKSGKPVPPKPGDRVSEATCLQTATDLYDVGAGRMLVLQFRCAPPFDKKEARQGLAAALKRDALTATAVGVAPAPAKRLVHPTTTGVVDLPRTPSFDPSKAAATYGKKRLPEGKWLRLLVRPEHQRAAEAVERMWKPFEEVVVDVWSGTDYARRLENGQWDAHAHVLVPDFDDPLAFLTPFRSRSGANAYSNPAFDALLKAAGDVISFRAKPDPAVAAAPGVKAALAGGDDEALRRALLAEAEAVLLEDAVVIPLWIPTDSGLVRSEVRGLHKGGGNRRLQDVHQLNRVGVGG